MLKKILCIAAVLCGFTGLAHGALTYTQTPALYLGATTRDEAAGTNHVATNNSGLTIAAWVGVGGGSFYIQRYDAKGNQLGSLMSINGWVFRNSIKAAVSPEGAFVVAWIDSGGLNNVLKARFYDEQGKLVKETTLADWHEGSFWAFDIVPYGLSIDGSGNVIVVYNKTFGIDNVWYSNLYSRRFNAQGERMGDTINVSVNNTSEDINPTLAVSGNGAFAVAWQRTRKAGCKDGTYSKPGRCDDILLRRFDNQGVPLGVATKIADGNTNLDQIPSIAMDNQGNFVVAWDRFRDLCQGMPQCDDILAQRYSTAGAKLGAAITIIANNNQNDIGPQAAMDGNGKFVVMWHRASIISGDTVLNPVDALFRAYDANGLSLGGNVSYRVASGLSTSQHDNGYPRVGISNSGTLNVIWGTGIDRPSSWGSSSKVLVFRQMIPSAW